MSKDNKKFTNIAFILLLTFLLISAVKAQKTPFQLADLFNSGDISALSSINSVSTPVSAGSQSTKTSESTRDPNVILSDFDKVKPRKINKTIDKSTAMSYTKTRSLSGTEILELGKMKKFSDCASQNKKMVIYVNKGSDSDIQAFIREFSKTKDKYRNSSKYLFISVDSLWDLNDNTIKNTHDRVINNIKQDCGLFCILDLRGEKLIKLKGSTVSKKGAEIVDVILNSL